MTRRRLTPTDDAGAVSVFVIGLVLVLMVVAGLVVDGGRAINARSALADDAEQAARAGANQIDENRLRTAGDVTIDAAAARRAAAEFLTVRGYGPEQVTVEADANEVHVSLTRVVPTQLLSLIMINDFTVDGEATARAAVGIVTELPEGAP